MDEDHSIVGDDEDEKEQAKDEQEHPGDAHGLSAGRPVGFKGSDATGGAVIGSHDIAASDDEMRGTPGGADENGSEAPEPDKPNLPHGPE